MDATRPKVFISYSWTSDDHQEFVRECADRLLSDGIDVVLDVYDLAEGDDKIAFIERMVTDDSVTNILVFCDKEYKEKSDEKKRELESNHRLFPSLYTRR